MPFSLRHHSRPGSALNVYYHPFARLSVSSLPRPPPPPPPFFRSSLVELGDTFPGGLDANSQHEGENGDNDVSPFALQLHGSVGHDQHAGNEDGSIQVRTERFFLFTPFLQ